MRTSPASISKVVLQLPLPLPPPPLPFTTALISELNKYVDLPQGKGRRRVLYYYVLLNMKTSFSFFKVLAIYIYHNIRYIKNLNTYICIIF